MTRKVPSARRHGPVASVIAVVLAAAGLLMGTAAPTPTLAALADGQLTLRGVASGLSKPLGIVNAADGSGRLFIVQQGGTVRVVKGDKLQSGAFLDISAKVESAGERGLLGLAFHPDFASNRRLFVYYTRTGTAEETGDIVVSRMTASSDGSSVPSASEVVLFTIEHSSPGNHNGGAMAFGPDGYLYLGVGDGGGAGDPDDNAPDPSSRLGKILRIDVDGTGEGPNGAYAVPPGNPYAGGGGDGSVFALGLRNPWRIAFDRTTGDLWIADVGQDAYEEIDRDVSPPTPDRDYGWSVMEGDHCYAASSCSTGGLIRPIAEYTHAKGCSITGGYVYRGLSQHDLQGLYVFADYCSGRIWTMASSGSTAITERLDTNLLITTFGESESGELYLVNQGGGLFRVIAPEFTDIAPSTFLDDIHWIFYAGLTVGCTASRYCPTDAVTREQMAIFLDRALDLPSTDVDAFTDDDGATGEAAINRIAAAGITTGCTPTTFCPDAVVTRAQMASFLARALDLDATPTDFFTDDATSTHQANINRIAAAGITTGCTPTTYCPKASVTRAQMAAFLRRAFE